MRKIKAQERKAWAQDEKKGSGAKVRLRRKSKAKEKQDLRGKAKLGRKR